jgi:hypothetical protein
MDKFVDTGKLSFSDLASSIVKDLLKIQLRMAMMQGISSMFGGLGGMFNSYVRSANEASPSFVGPLSSMATAASGGTVDGPTIVGENGPELFVPGRSGSVIPNNTMGNAMGGTTNVTNNYINAIDTKSFEDRLYGSNKAIWAANQYASKNISTSRSRT